MDENTLNKKIAELKPWYQNIKFTEKTWAVSSHSKLSGEYAWRYIKQLLPESLEGKRVLDLGSNAGLFSVRAAQMGAEEVIGIEKESKHLKQCSFVKEYFKADKVRFINHDLEEICSLDLGKFDYIFAIAVLYWVGRGRLTNRNLHYDKVYRDKEVEFIEYISKLSDNFVVRVRGQEYNNTEYYSEIFSRYGAGLEKALKEDTGSHEMLLFRRPTNG